MNSNNLNLQNILAELDEARIEELRLVLDEYYPQDIAEAYSKLDSENKLLIFDILSSQQAASVITELETHEIESLFQKLSDDKISRFANEMALDDAADILSLLEDKRMLKILEHIHNPIEIKELLSFDPDTCGGIMTPAFISVRADLKIAAALRYVRLKAREEENQIMYIYVTQKFGELLGVMSIRELFLAPDNDIVGNHIDDDILFVKTDDDQEKAAELISKYRLLAIPVVNNNHQLVGIITVDDAVDVIEEETTEDLYQSSGINIESETSNSARSLVREYFGAYKARTPWLIITLFGQYLAATLIAKFDTTIATIPIAISFMPLLSGLSGNIGNQSSTIIVRGLSTGEVDITQSIKIFLHELLVSACIGLTCALLIGTLSFYVYHNVLLSCLISMSLVLTMMLAVALGTIIPIGFKRLDLDPAIASGPLITTVVDMTTFFVYLSLITRFIHMLV